MICPICQKGRLLQVAPDMYQCAACGNGPSNRGFHWAWSLSYITKINRDDKGVDIVAVVIHYDKFKDSYNIGSLMWTENASGSPEAASVDSSTLGTIEEDELVHNALPVVWLSKQGKLKEGMFPLALGRKEKI